MQSLIACISQTKGIDIKTIAMGTLLDLVNINLCVFPSPKGNQRAESVASVIPLISHADFVILDQSQVYKVSKSYLYISLVLHKLSAYVSLSTYVMMEITLLFSCFSFVSLFS